MFLNLVFGDSPIAHYETKFLAKMIAITSNSVPSILKENEQMY